MTAPVAPAPSAPSIGARVASIKPQRPDISLPAGRAQRIVLVASLLVLAASWAQDIAKGNAPEARPLLGAAFLAIVLSIAAEFAPSVAEALALLVLVATLLSLDKRVLAGLTNLLSKGARIPGQPKPEIAGKDSTPKYTPGPVSNTATTVATAGVAGLSPTVPKLRPIIH